MQPRAVVACRGLRQALVAAPGSLCKGLPAIYCGESAAYYRVALRVADLRSLRPGCAAEENVTALRAAGDVGEAVLASGLEHAAAQPLTMLPILPLVLRGGGDLPNLLLVPVLA